MRRLTAEQRYWQAIRKAHIIAHRQMEACLRDGGVGECWADIEHRCVIAEIARSMESDESGDFSRDDPTRDPRG